MTFEYKAEHPRKAGLWFRLRTLAGRGVSADGGEEETPAVAEMRTAVAEREEEEVAGITASAQENPGR